MTIISQNHRLVFIHIPKCGGSSVETAFQEHVRWGDFVVGSTREGEILHKQVFNRLYGISKHSTAAELRLALGDALDGMRVAAVVREPLKLVESYYRFSRTIHRWIASGVESHNPGVSLELAMGKALDIVRSGKLEQDPQFGVLLLHSGTVREGVLSASFEEFLARVGDRRWSGYLASYLDGADGQLLATDILKLEEPDRVEQFFRGFLGPGFRLGHENASIEADTPWPAAERRRFHDLTAGEYERFGYAFRP